jgi:hypothetical protein
MTKFAIDDRLDDVDIHFGGRFDPRHLGSYLCPMEELAVTRGCYDNLLVEGAAHFCTAFASTELTRPAGTHPAISYVWLGRELFEGRRDGFAIAVEHCGHVSKHARQRLGRRSYKSDIGFFKDRETDLAGVMARLVG